MAAPKPKGRIRKAFKAAAFAAKVVAGRQLTQNQIKLANRGARKLTMSEGKIENLGGFETIDQYHSQSKSKNYFSGAGEVHVVLTKRSGTRNVGTLDKEVHRIFTPEGKLKQKTVYTGDGGKTKTTDYVPAGRFFGKRRRN